MRDGRNARDAAEPTRTAVHRPRRASRQARGLTLVDTLVALALVALLVSMAVPSFGHQAARWRLQAAATDLATTLREARTAAALTGSTQHVQLSAGPSWCWSASPEAACRCDAPVPCGGSLARATDHPGISVSGAARFVFDPVASARSGREPDVELRSAHGDRLRVGVTPLGRARICAPEAATAIHPRC